MEIQKYISDKKNLYNALSNFIQSEDDINDYFQMLIDSIEYEKNQGDLKSLLYLLSYISENHHRSQNLIKKIEEIIIKIEQDIKQTFSNFQIYNIFKNNKRILYFLFKNEIIVPDESIIEFMTNNFNLKFLAFFYFEIKSIIEVNKEKFPIDFNSKIEKELSLNFEDQEFLSSFEENRQKGENDSYICSLIRDDLVEDFITHVNRNNISPMSRIKPSIFETNSFLLDREASLIEYAAFFGSIEIFKYLQFNNVELNSSLWLYTIHGNNADMIHLLEDNHIDPNENKSYKECLEESIKCHHNDIANYILSNKTDEIADLKIFDHNNMAYGFHYHNYSFLTEDFDKNLLFFYSCEYDYFMIVELLLKDKEIDINSKIIKKYFFLIK